MTLLPHLLRYCEASALTGWCVDIPFIAAAHCMTEPACLRTFANVPDERANIVTEMALVARRMSALNAGVVY